MFKYAVYCVYSIYTHTMINHNCIQCIMYKRMLSFEASTTPSAPKSLHTSSGILKQYRSRMQCKELFCWLFILSRAPDGGSLVHVEKERQQCNVPCVLFSLSFLQLYGQKQALYRDTERDSSAWRQSLQCIDVKAT